MTEQQLSKKTTILFPPDLFAALEKIAKEKKTSVGDLVRTAVKEQYQINSKASKMAIFDKMMKAEFPVWEWQEIEKDYEDNYFA